LPFDAIPLPVPFAAVVILDRIAAALDRVAETLAADAVPPVLLLLLPADRDPVMDMGEDAAASPAVGGDVVSLLLLLLFDRSDDPDVGVVVVKKEDEDDGSPIIRLIVYQKARLPVMIAGPCVCLQSDSQGERHRNQC
jgi:microcystin degradation protein MlrC